MDRSIAAVEERAAEHVETYRESAPFYPVEEEAIGSLADAFRAGEYGKRDVEWVVRWYFRRRVGDVDHGGRREVEEAVADADRRELRGHLWDAIDALDGTGNGAIEGGDENDGDGAGDDDGTVPAHHRALAALTELPGVDVAVGSALLWFLAPDQYMVVGDREWEVVAGLTDGDRGVDIGVTLDGDYPEPMTVDAYDRYLDAVRSLADRIGVSHWELYMILQREYAETAAEE